MSKVGEELFPKRTVPSSEKKEECWIARAGEVLTSEGEEDNFCWLLRETDV